MSKAFWLMGLIFLSTGVNAQQVIRGRVLGRDEGPLVSASIQVKGRQMGTFTDTNGTFSLSVVPTDTLLISSMGYVTRKLWTPFKLEMEIILEPANQVLREVLISTGYQTIAKERATGSFAQIDNELLNRAVGTNLIDRLRDIVPGLSFNRSGASTLSIRGQSTIYGNAEPLIVLDNFPFEGSLQDINPNDVESITVLRDAAAASIWGARAGNGVIVITTKKGKMNQAVQVSLNVNVNRMNTPDLFINNRLSSADYIDIEKQLFARGYYDAAHLTGFEPLTPVVELLYQKKANPAMGQALDSQIDALKGLDVRRDFEKHIYQKNLDRQYALNLRGGGKYNSYYLSAGLDENRDNLVGNSLSRMSLAATNTFKFLKGRLDLTTGANYIVHHTISNAVGTNISNSTAGGAIYPYAQLADVQGNYLPIIKSYRPSFITEAQSNGLLDWTYIPLNETGLADFTTNRKTLRLNGSMSYQLMHGLRASLRYQHTDVATLGRNARSQDSYFVRDLINRFTQLNGGSVIRPIPLGGILDVAKQSLTDHSMRAQLDFDRNFGADHQITAIAGFEGRRSTTSSSNNRSYGYDERHAQITFVNYTDIALPLYYDPSRKGQIPFVDALGLYNDRFRSYYANAAYTFLKRYTLSSSARLDQSNLFGVRTNQKGVPLWSVGTAWDIAKEGFYGLEMLPTLKLRATYGYNGNLDKSVSAYTTAAFSGYLFNLPYATITNPPNPSLRWERVKTWNLGLDFATKGNRIAGAVEFYHKQGLDLIGDQPMPPSSGVTLFRGNVASTVSTGLELDIHSKNLQGLFYWQTDLVLSMQRERVVDYEVAATALQYIQSGVNLPLKGKPLYGLYGYSWAGLDAATGDPIGYLNGQQTKDYAAIVNTTKVDQLHYIGSRRPTTFGGLRNTFRYAEFSLSLNISYSLGYFFRKNSVTYGNNLGLSANHSDYSQRWRSPGDELNTIVPSVPLLVNNNRDLFYRYADVLTDRADNIRLQDIRLDYTLLNRKWMPFQQVQFYTYFTNLGVLWKATKFDVDPDIQNSNYPLSMAFGLKINFK